MKNLLLLLGLVLSFQTIAQKKINYMKVRDELRPPICGFRDSLSTAEVYARLQAFDTLTLRKNIAQYYHDVAEMEYLLFMYTGNSKMLQQSIKNELKELYHDPKSDVSWSIAFRFHLFGECDQMEKYLLKYKKDYPSAYRKKEGEIELLRKNCEENRKRINGANQRTEK